MSIEEIIMSYWKSWQSHSDWDVTRRYMKDYFKLDAGIFKTESADQLIEMMKKGNPWKEINLLDFVVTNNKGALVYEGIDSVTNVKTRISKIITVVDNKVASCITTIAPLSGKE
ncbi:hypothetical protein U6A24_14550 [Aquimarina gracilis]|uniref:SnoaL-like protein n=1 Tax=Aquimarina gracilis TaxID=874422 RepID=A0ABU5ZY00_9FLAO|nr:hypothetical protein [Aquimarina gracilis]MEB3346695.1 hypothetical protein [Aquimarina gracilis]